MRVSRRAFTVSARRLDVVPATKTETAATKVTEGGEVKEIEQAPNRVERWSRNQKARSKAMTGPRFEQTDFDLQVGLRHSAGRYKKK